MIELLMFGGVAATMLAGFKGAKRFVIDRLRYVEAIQRARAPFLAGAAATVAAAPVMWLLPVVGGGSAVLIGAAVGYGVARGAREVRRGNGREVMVV